MVHEKYDKNKVVIMYLSDWLLKTIFKFTETIEIHVIGMYTPINKPKKKQTPVTTNYRTL